MPEVEPMLQEHLDARLMACGCLDWFFDGPGYELFKRTQKPRQLLPGPVRGALEQPGRRQRPSHSRQKNPPRTRKQSSGHGSGALVSAQAGREYSAKKEHSQANSTADPNRVLRPKRPQRPTVDTSFLNKPPPSKNTRDNSQASGSKGGSIPRQHSNIPDSAAPRKPESHQEQPKGPQASRNKANSDKRDEINPIHPDWRRSTDSP